MHLLISVLLLAIGACQAMYWQKLTCPTERKHESLPRVWCRQSSTKCCTGLTFSQNAHLVEGGKLRVTQDSDSFTIAVAELSHGEGVYWCGVLNRNNSIIKLAEGYFHRSSGAYIWSFARWIVLPLVPMVTIVIYCRKSKDFNEKTKGPHNDIVVSRTQMDPQYENVASCELE